MSETKKLKVTLVRSLIGVLDDQQATVAALGLIHNDTPAIRGMLFKVKHLVTVEEVK